MKVSKKITAVLLNWKRPEGVKKICSRLNQFNLVDEIIVWNNNPDIRIDLDEEKARLINCNDDFGLFTRFAAASLAKNECILFHDDDIMTSEEVLNDLYNKWEKLPTSCHTMFGRNPKNGKYSMNTHYGPVEIVLTRFVMVHRDVAMYALAKTPQFSDLPGKPIGNGEDIILSYAAIDYSGRLNRAYKMETTDLYEEDEHAINTRYPEHIQHRTKIIQRCKEVFEQKKRLLFWNKIYQQYEKVKIYMSQKFGE